MKASYGIERVLEPKHVLPTSAWKLDNSRYLLEGEMRIDVKRIHIEGTSFKEICLEGGDNEQKIKQKIMDIVIRRGKLHNPVTDTGGLLYGVISEIDDEYPNPKKLKVGDEVICNASLASVPLSIEEIISIDRAYGQIEVEGYAIITEVMPVLKKPEDLPLKLLMYTLDESGTIYRISSTAVGKRRVLVVGNNLLSNLLFGVAIRKVARDNAEVVCLLDRNTDAVLKGESIDKLTEEVFSEVHYGDILRPLECLDMIKGGGLFDLSVNCVDITGAETINILATKSGGTVVFTNLINNYNIALYITEAISRQLDIRCADGYLEAYDAFDFEIVREMTPYIENAEEIITSLGDDPAHPISKKSRMMKTAGARLSIMDDFVYDSNAMQMVMDEILTVSKYDCNVLINGENGTGKEKIASIIYKNSDRKLQPYIKVNCGSIAPELFESKIFGKEGGRRTDAEIGYLEQADNGTVFLDDIGEIPPEMQIKLLRAIQDGEYFRQGGATAVKMNVRIISASTKDLEELIEKDIFRRDLYYQLNVVRIKVPALRDRTADIPGLVDHFMKEYGEKFGIKRGISEDAVDYLRQSDWPGNVRELENFVQRIMIGATSEIISLIDVMREMHSDVFDPGMVGLTEELDENIEEVNMETMVENFEKNIIRHALEKYGSTRKAAKAIGISQTQLVRKKNKYGL